MLSVGLHVFKNLATNFFFLLSPFSPFKVVYVCCCSLASPCKQVMRHLHITQILSDYTQTSIGAKEVDNEAGSKPGEGGLRQVAGICGGWVGTAAV